MDDAATLARLGEAMADYQLDPLGFVRAVYPWGEPGELADFAGPRDWQVEALGEIGDRLRAGHAPGAAMMPVLKSVSSGHGIGKTAFLATLGWWGLSTMVDARVIITANTENQLRTRTWPEIVKWTRLAANRAMFKVQGLQIRSASPANAQNWRWDAVTWSENNLVAFQGLHNLSRRLVILFEEASGIADAVWDTTEGSLTDVNTEIVWAAVGNPTEPAGRFAECFGRQRARWHGKQIDARTVPGTNLAQAAEWIALYGEDHDFVRVRVRGMFPRSGSMQFIASETVAGARGREPVPLLTDPLIAGLDVARSLAGDQTVLRFRKGRDARSIPARKWRTDNLMNIAGATAELCLELRVDQLFVDIGGVGAGVYDRLQQLGIACIGIQFGMPSDRINYSGAMPSYANKRAEMWGNMREWLAGGAIDDDPELIADLVGPQYDFVVKQGRDAIMLERKKDMKARRLASPDDGDALCFVAGTMIQTPRGAVPIEALQPGDEVTTPFRTARVEVTWQSDASRLTTVKFSNGAQLRGKGEHKIFAWSSGVVRLDTLPLTIEVEPYGRWRLVLWRMASFCCIGARNTGFKKLVDITVRERPLTASGFFIAACGRSATALFRRACTSITRTVTGVTHI